VSDPNKPLGFVSLKSVTGGLAEPTGDAGLDTVLAEIELRVEVELAKIGMPQSGTQRTV